MSKVNKTIIERLDDIITLNTSLLEEVKSLHADLNKSNAELIEKEAPVNVEVKTSTAEEIKEALKPINVELLQLRRRP